jgi:hypothetical protein
MVVASMTVVAIVVAAIVVAVATVFVGGVVGLGGECGKRSASGETGGEEKHEGAAKRAKHNGESWRLRM